ncbi:MAG: rRNA adenine N-6-methyltransferase family protein, partial [Bacteroidota bacterium]
MVRAKKYLGQHFLKDEEIAKQIVSALTLDSGAVLEIGPGTGVLSKYLFDQVNQLFLMDIDAESIRFLHAKYPQYSERTIEADFLKSDLAFLPNQYRIIGNFPYNISSQIFFRVLEERDHVKEVVCMLQKEVAKRLCSPPGNKQYGILSVL